MCNFAICWGFNFKYGKNDLRRVIACYAKLRYSWKVHAVCSDPSNGIFQIKEFKKNYSCGGGIVTLDHPRASKHWVSSIISDKLNQRPLYQAIDFQNDIHDEYGIQIPYHRAWWSKEV